MKLASLKAGGRDGTLVVVGRSLRRSMRRAVAVPELAATLQAALEDWAALEPELGALSRRLDEGRVAGAFELDHKALAAPLPRAYQWLDGSAYLNHVELVRKARGAELPPELHHDPLMYQGGSDAFLGPRDDILCAAEDWGIDFEAEVAVITGDVAMGAGREAAAAAIRLVVLVNDVSLRNLIPAELAKGFGFLHGKPATAFAPLALTPDELGPAWDGGKLSLPLVTELNGFRFGDADAGADMSFDFPTLIAHAARTRSLSAGTVIGAGTVSNRDPARGAACIAERRAREQIEHGAPRTAFLSFGDRVRIEMLDGQGHSLFGAIDQRVVKYRGPG